MEKVTGLSVDVVCIEHMQYSLRCIYSTKSCTQFERCVQPFPVSMPSQINSRAVGLCVSLHDTLDHRPRRWVVVESFIINVRHCLFTMQMSGRKEKKIRRRWLFVKDAMKYLNVVGEVPVGDT